MGKFDEFVWWIFCGLLSGCAVYGVSVLARLTASIQLLNEQIARLLEKTAWHEKELVRLDERLGRMEDKQ